MIQTLNDALASLDLKPGESYLTTVDGREFEVRALDRSKSEAKEKSQFADQVMLDAPWLTIPSSPKRITVLAKIGKLRLPDPPIIPPEYEGFE